MPVIKSAEKKLRQDKKKRIKNQTFTKAFTKLVKSARKNPAAENIQKAVKATDKAAKKNIIHKNKASRIKANLYKLSKTDTKSTKTINKKSN